MCQGKVLLVGESGGFIRCIDMDRGEVSTLAGRPRGKSRQFAKQDLMEKFSEVVFHDIAKIVASAVVKGVLYVVDRGQHCVFRLNTLEETSCVICGFPGRAGRGVVEGIVLLNSPSSLCELADGSLVVCDTNNSCLKLVDTKTFRACTVTQAKKGWVDGLLAKSHFCQPSDIACDEAGRLFVADRGNNAIRIVELGGAAECRLDAMDHVRQSRVVDEILGQSGVGRRFAVYCRECQAECDFGNDQTCARCGSHDVVVHDLKPQGARDRLVSDVFYRGDDQPVAQAPPSASLGEEQPPDGAGGQPQLERVIPRTVPEEVHRLNRVRAQWAVEPADLTVRQLGWAEPGRPGPAGTGGQAAEGPSPIHVGSLHAGQSGLLAGTAVARSVTETAADKGEGRDGERPAELFMFGNGLP